MKAIARIYNDFTTRFGVPRQSGLSEITSVICMEPDYRVADAFRGIEGFSHLWLLWEFSETKRDTWSPTVRPPRLGGNARMGVFATRSPFRPNPIGLSSVKLERFVPVSPDGPLLYVSGADLMNGTPIYDIKPYLAFTDAHPEALGGFADPVRDYALEVVFPKELLALIPQEKHTALFAVLKNDPRPSYQIDPDRIYGVSFGGFDIRFCVSDKTLTVTEVISL